MFIRVFFAKNNPANEIIALEKAVAQKLFWRALLWNPFAVMLFILAWPFLMFFVGMIDGGLVVVLFIGMVILTFLLTFLAFLELTSDPRSVIWSGTFTSFSYLLNRHRTLKLTGSLPLPIITDQNHPWSRDMCRCQYCEVGTASDDDW